MESSNSGAIKILVAIILLIVGTFLAIRFAEIGKEFNTYFFEIGVTLTAISLGFIINSIFQNLRIILLITHITVRGYWNKKIRISLSYLYSIRVKNSKGIDQYLLVKNKRTDGFQPVGGVYKYYDKTPISQLHASSAKNFHEKKDFRLRIKGRHLSAFLKYFDSRKNREVEFHREFREELITTNILSAEIFDTVLVEYLGQKTSGFRYSKHLKCWEVNFYDIVQPRFTQQQEEKLCELFNHPELTRGFQLVSEKLIESSGMCETEGRDVSIIQEHTTHIL